MNLLAKLAKSLAESLGIITCHFRNFDVLVSLFYNSTFLLGMSPVGAFLLGMSLNISINTGFALRHACAALGARFATFPVALLAIPWHVGVFPDVTIFMTSATCGLCMRMFPHCPH